MKRAWDSYTQRRAERPAKPQARLPEVAPQSRTACAPHLRCALKAEVRGLHGRTLCALFTMAVDRLWCLWWLAGVQTCRTHFARECKSVGCSRVHGGGSHTAVHSTRNLTIREQILAVPPLPLRNSCGVFKRNL